MFGFFKNILKRQAEVAPEQDQLLAAEDAPVDESHDPVPASISQPARAKSGNGHRTNGHGNGHNGGNGNGHAKSPTCSTGIELPLEPILKALPLELQPRVKSTNVGAATIYIPLEKILSQLSRGAVNLSFGELRRAAPDLFVGPPDRDRTLVPLPLSEILSRLNPAILTRRRTQRTVEVPAEISSPFQSRGQGLIFSLGQAKGEPPAAEQSQEHTPVLPPATINRKTISALPTPPPPGTAGPKPLSLVNAASDGKRFETPNAPIRFKQNAPAPQPAAPQPKHPPLMVALAALAENWPDAIRQEIVQLNLVESKVGLPAEAVERALKQGRIAFTWKMLRSWIHPSPLPAVSAHDGSVLELPLKVVAPLFIERQTEAAKTKPTIAIDEAIPNLFFGFPQPEPGVSSAPQTGDKPLDTNYYVWDDTSDTALVDESQVKRAAAASTPGTSFVNRYATPNEIVSRAASLEGVAGALIALPDGLMVASRLSPEVNGETLAAFLPQIFGKVSQCTKELRMGELNNLNFTVGNVPWKIFRVHAIFFAALGYEGMPLPTAQLAALAAELNHKPK